MKDQVWVVQPIIATKVPASSQHQFPNVLVSELPAIKSPLAFKPSLKELTEFLSNPNPNHRFWVKEIIAVILNH